VEVSRLEWGLVKTHEARVVRMPRSVAEKVSASLAARPHSPEALVFTAPMGGPLSRADFVRNCFKPAVLAANEAIAKLPKDRRPAPLPDGLRFYDLRHTCAACSSTRVRASRRCGRSWAMRPPGSPSTPTGTCSRPRWRRSLTAWRWCGMPPWRSGHGPSTDQQTTAWGSPQADDLVSWRRLRGSNPRGSCPPTRFPGVCLRPLGQASAGKSSQPQTFSATGHRLPQECGELLGCHPDPTEDSAGQPGGHAGTRTSNEVTSGGCGRAGAGSSSR
jgi:hypothetical protein